MSDRTEVHAEIEKFDSLPHGEVHLITFLKDYVFRHPDDWRAILAYGDSLRVIGRCVEATQALRPAYEASSNKSIKAELALRIAMAFELASPAEAEYWFEISTGLEGDKNGWVWILRGANLMRLERFDDAIDCYNRAMQLPEVDKDEALKNIAFAYRAKGDYHQALVFLKRLRMLSNEENASLQFDLEGLEKVAYLAKKIAGD